MSILKKVDVDTIKEPEMYEVDKTHYRTDRYRKHRRYVDENGYEVPEAYSGTHIPESEGDIYHQIEPGEENALDLIAYRFYKDDNLWWVIAEASGIDDPFNVPVGTVLRIPAQTTLYGFRGILA